MAIGLCDERLAKMVRVKDYGVSGGITAPGGFF